MSSSASSVISYLLLIFGQHSVFGQIVWEYNSATFTVGKAWAKFWRWCGTIHHFKLMLLSSRVKYFSNVLLLNHISPKYKFPAISSAIISLLWLWIYHIRPILNLLIYNLMVKDNLPNSKHYVFFSIIKNIKCQRVVVTKFISHWSEVCLILASSSKQG